MAVPATLNTPLATKLAPLTLPETVTTSPFIPLVVILPTLALPVTVNKPLVTKLPPCTLPVAIINPEDFNTPASTLPDKNICGALILPEKLLTPVPVTFNTPPVAKLPPITLPVADTFPPADMLSVADKLLVEFNVLTLNTLPLMLPDAIISVTLLRLPKISALPPTLIRPSNNPDP